jgi:hypothetical protein
VAGDCTGAKTVARVGSRAARLRPGVGRFIGAFSLANVRHVRQVADVFGPGSTALSMGKVAERALEHDDEEVRRLTNQRLAELQPTTRVTRPSLPLQIGQSVTARRSIQPHA